MIVDFAVYEDVRKISAWAANRNFKRIVWL
jgi:hypothetical protein